MTLYRRYRPTTFAELIGQDSARKTMMSSLARGNIAHAYLFTGPRGTGKTSLARLFARAACCTNPLRSDHEYEPCGTCPSCLSIATGDASDILEIDAASNRGIDDIRALRESALFSPSQLKYRIFIVDEVHMLTGEAFNALLKTLEEPPSHALFLLATTELHKVPATVRSRCVLLSLFRAETPAIVKKLTHIVELESIDIEPAALSVIAAAADGSFRDAETILEKLSSETGTVTAAVARERLGTISTAVCESLVAGLLARNREAILSILEQELSDSTLRFDSLYRQLLESLYGQLPDSPELLGVTQNILEASLLERTSPIAGLPLRLALFEYLYESTPMRKSTSTGSENTSTVQNIIAISPQTSPTEVPVLPVTAVSTLPETPNTQARKREPNVREAWRKMCESSRRENPVLSELLKLTTLYSAEAGTVTVHVSQKFHLDTLTSRKNLKLITEGLEKQLSEPWNVVFELQKNLEKEPRRRRITSQAPSISPTDISSVFSVSET